MEVIYGLIPGMIFMGARSGQFDDMEGDAQRILMDDSDVPLKHTADKPAVDTAELNDKPEDK